MFVEATVKLRLFSMQLRLHRACHLIGLQRREAFISVTYPKIARAEQIAFLTGWRASMMTSPYQ